MATKLTKKQKEALTDKIAGLIRSGPALRMTTDSSVNEMNINQISGELNRIHYRAIGKDLPAVISFEPKQLGSGDPSPDNIRPIVGYEIDGIGTVYGGELNINTSILIVNYGIINLGSVNWSIGNTGCFTGIVPGIKRAAGYNIVADIICVCYVTATANEVYSEASSVNKAIAGIPADDRVWIRDTSYTDISSFTAAMNGMDLLYALATPAEYSLTSVQMLQLIDQL